MKAKIISIQGEEFGRAEALRVYFDKKSSATKTKYERILKNWEDWLYNKHKLNYSEASVYHADDYIAHLKQETGQLGGKSTAATILTKLAALHSIYSKALSPCERKTGRVL